MSARILIERIKQIPSDLSIKCKDGQVDAIKSFIMSASDPFRTMLTNFKEGAEDLIVFPDESVSTIQAFVNYVQYSEIPIDERDMCLLSVFLDKYSVPHDDVMEAIMEGLYNIQRQSRDLSKLIDMAQICNMECHEYVRESISRIIFENLIHNWEYMCNECKIIIPALCKKCDATKAQNQDHGHLPHDNHKHIDCKNNGTFIVNHIEEPVVDLSEIDSTILGDLAKIYFSKM